MMNRLADQLLAQQEQWVERIVLETGKPSVDAMMGDLLPAVSLLRYLADEGPCLLKEQLIPPGKSFWMGRVHVRRRRPRGVVAVVSPWNYPLAIPVSGIATALMAGNAVVFKPSEWTTGLGLAVADAFRALLAEEGAQDVLQTVIGMGETGAALVESEVDYAIFTGSHKTGRRVQAAMASRGKQASLELGGSDPMIVLPGADPEAVTSYALWGRWTNAGQACAAVKRLLVPASELERYGTLLAEKAARLLPGEHIGPLITSGQRELVHQQVEDALSRGARCLVGGSFVADQPGFYYEPTVLTQVPLEARVWQEEVFGPVLPILPYHSMEEAVQLANETPMGLGASIFGDPKQASALAEQLRAGMVAINDLPTMGYALPRIPWGGCKNSGPGRSHGAEGLLDVTELQIVTRNWLYSLPGLTKPFWHFGPKSDPGFARVMLKTFSSERLRDKLHPGLLAALWRNRSATRW
jgi:succinate-semialdehyde dehydrogenase/glutarate-semialdehyde dehydrogenase